MQGQDWWRYENLPSGEPYDWAGAGRGDSPWDNLDFHLDIGCGRLPKGRLGIDRFYAPAGFPQLLIDLETLRPALLRPDEGCQHDQTVDLYKSNPSFMLAAGPSEFRSCLPFPSDSIESIISHHCMEHLSDGFLPLMDECHRVLKPGGILRVIVPLFPSRTAVEDPDHKRYFMEGTFETFCGDSEGNHWHESFSTPYTSCRFLEVDRDISPRPEDPAEYWGEADAREIRVALKKQGA
jgi:SAM-dependent methyltransferase